MSKTYSSHPPMALKVSKHGYACDMRGIQQVPAIIHIHTRNSPRIVSLRSSLKSEKQFEILVLEKKCCVSILIPCE